MRIPNLTKVFILLGIMTLIECCMAGLIGLWRDPFWNAVSNHDLNKFILYIIYFATAALIACLVSGYGQYLANYASLILRHRLTKKAMHIQQSILGMVAEKIENLPQRIQEDCFKYPSLYITLVVGGIKNLAIMLTYMGILFYQLSGVYLIVPIVYAILGSLIAFKIANPLIHLNYVNQNFEAKFRQFLTKRNYGLVHRNNHNLFKYTKYLSYFQSFFNQITVIVPYILLAPVYFASKISFGIMMQSASAINTVIDCLSYGLNSFGDINKLLSCRKRLKEIGVI